MSDYSVDEFFAKYYSMEEKLNKSEKCCNHQDIIDDGVALATNILNLNTPSPFLCHNYNCW